MFSIKQKRFWQLQFLVLLIQQAPGDVAKEREKLAQLMADSVRTLQSAQDAAIDHEQCLESRLAELPAEVSRGISPAAIAQRINEDLRVRFSNIPETAQTLSATSEQMSRAVVEFDTTARQDRKSVV